MPETYRIDEADKRVYVSDGIDPVSQSVHFDIIARATSEVIAGGKDNKHDHWSLVPAGRRMCFAVARDELLERGLIQEVMT